MPMGHGAMRLSRETAHAWGVSSFWVPRRDKVEDADVAGKASRQGPTWHPEPGHGSREGGSDGKNSGAKEGSRAVGPVSRDRRGREQK
jgi:hypothetical protein